MAEVFVTMLSCSECWAWHDPDDPHSECGCWCHDGDGPLEDDDYDDRQET